MIRNSRSTIHDLDQFFMGTAPLYQTIERLSKTLGEMNLPFVISGAMAVNHHGHRRATQDVGILMRRKDLGVFKEEHLGRGWLNKFEGSKGFIDTIHQIPVDVLIAGDFPGDGKAKPVSFPDPDDQAVVEFEDGLPYLRLEKLIELKLACGMSAPERLQDFADVIALVKTNDLKESFGQTLNSYVIEAWLDLWKRSQITSGEY